MLTPLGDGTRRHSAAGFARDMVAPGRKHHTTDMASFSHVAVLAALLVARKKECARTTARREGAAEEPRSAVAEGAVGDGQVSGGKHAPAGLPHADISETEMKREGITSLRRDDGCEGGREN